MIAIVVGGLVMIAGVIWRRTGGGLPLIDTGIDPFWTWVLLAAGWGFFFILPLRKGEMQTEILAFSREEQPKRFWFFAFLYMTTFLLVVAMTVKIGFERYVR